MTCELCAKDDGNYDYDNDCCMTRFILHVPTKTLRAGYLNWYITKLGQHRADNIKRMVSEAWENRGKQ